MCLAHENVKSVYTSATLGGMIGRVGVGVLTFLFDSPTRESLYIISIVCELAGDGGDLTRLGGND
jgi:hypothetical protein